MKINIKTTKEELSGKTDKLIKAVSQVIEKVDPELSDTLLKALPIKDELFTDPVMLELLKTWEVKYRYQMDLMVSDIKKVFDKKSIKKSMDLTKADDPDKAWIGVDLDGTLAEYTEYKGPEHIGKPIPKMVNRVKEWIVEGRTVKIMTARADIPVRGSSKPIWVVEDWCKEVFGQKLPVVCRKDLHMIELWDDRAVQVIKNTGERADGSDDD